MMTKMKSATLMLISAATLAAGAYGLNGQSSKPEPAPSGSGTAGRTTSDVVDVNRDPVAELVRIAREVQKRREAGDVAGAKIAFVAGSPGGGTSVWSVLANGTKLRRLTSATGRDELSPAWVVAELERARGEHRVELPAEGEVLQIAR